VAWGDEKRGGAGGEESFTSRKLKFRSDNVWEKKKGGGLLPGEENDEYVVEKRNWSVSS